MASPVAIAKIRCSALVRLNAACERIAKQTDVPMPSIGKLSKDRDLDQARRIENLATWAERVATSLEPAAAPDAALPPPPPAGDDPVVSAAPEAVEQSAAPASVELPKSVLPIEMVTRPPRKAKQA